VLKLTVVKAHVASACHENEMLPSKPINVLGATIITGVRPMAKSSITGAGVRLRINGSEHLLQIEPRVTLLDALREYAHLNGTKKGCDQGQCGACTVHVDGRRVLDAASGSDSPILLWLHNVCL
jgi:ferredoxin